MVPWSLVRVLPKRLISRSAGWLARRRISRWRIRAYVKKHQCNIVELDRDLKKFRSLQDFFTRPLKEGCRPISDDPIDLVSPVDGMIQQQGLIEKGRVIQAKGQDYRVTELLGEENPGLEGGLFITLYLSPGDYHRIHTPAGSTLVGARHLPGTLWPMNEIAVKRVASLYIKNERVVVELTLNSRDRIWMVLVGATVVGRIRLAHDPEFGSRRRQKREERYRRRLDRGELLGWFETGSTVIVLIGPGIAEQTRKQGERVLVGEPLARLISDLELDS